MRGIGCVLRVAGGAFDVDAFLRDTAFEPVAVYRKGESRGRLRSRGPSTTSGCNVLVSEGDDLAQQCQDAVAFLRVHGDALRRARRDTTIEFFVLDFSTSFRDVAVQSEQFSPELVTAAGMLGLGIELSLYPRSSDGVQ